MTLYEGTKSWMGEEHRWEWSITVKEGYQKKPLKRVSYHTGPFVPMTWGNHGSSAADTALSILYNFFEETADIRSPEFFKSDAWKIHHAFLAEFVSQWNGIWGITSDDINDFVGAYRATKKIMSKNPGPMTSGEKSEAMKEISNAKQRIINAPTTES